jgi:hypothetical protein
MSREAKRNGPMVNPEERDEQIKKLAQGFKVIAQLYADQQNQELKRQLAQAREWLARAAYELAVARGQNETTEGIRTFLAQHKERTNG